MTANEVGWNHSKVVASASTVEHSIRDAFEWGRSCNVKAATFSGEVLALRLKMAELVLGLGGEAQMDAEKEIEKKVKESGSDVWAVVKALRKRGVKGLDGGYGGGDYGGSGRGVVDDRGDLKPQTP